MLTLTLRNLERDGLISRTAFATIPPRVEYELTTLGQSLTQPLSVLAAWASTHRQDVERSQSVYDSAQQPKPKVPGRAHVEHREAEISQRP